MKGNLVDMAVAFVMGGAFATVVTAFIQGVFLPLLSPVMGGIDLASFNWTMQPEVLDAEGNVTKAAVVVAVGDFIAALISFLIVAFVMFIFIKNMNNMKKKEEEAAAAAPPAPPKQEVLLEEIRDALKARN